MDKNPLHEFLIKILDDDDEKKILNLILKETDKERIIKELLKLETDEGNTNDQI